MKNQSGTIKTNPVLYRVVMGGSGGYRRLPGGSDDFSWQTNRHFIIIYISSQPEAEVALLSMILRWLKNNLHRRRYHPHNYRCRYHPHHHQSQKQRLLLRIRSPSMGKSRLWLLCTRVWNDKRFFFLQSFRSLKRWCVNISSFMMAKTAENLHLADRWRFEYYKDSRYLYNIYESI